jgi:hypothetical protein
MVEGTGLPKDASSMFRTMRGGNVNFRDGDTLALEHACRMSEAAGRVIDQQNQRQNRGNFRGRRFNNYRGDYQILEVVEATTRRLDILNVVEITSRHRSIHQLWPNLNITFLWL